MPNIPNNYYRISIKALILDDRQRFLLFLENNGWWELPGGGLDYEETPQSCLIRELREEAGLEVTWVNDAPSYFVTGQNNDGHWKANVVYEVKVKNLTIKHSDECVEVRFFTKEEALKENLYPTVRQFSEQYRP